ncbi:MAG TPA: glycosyltransferase [Candidatus Binataceae bacterium]|nr:glycosyltransferase [Candidatus Binataceae bacterium]
MIIVTTGTMLPFDRLVRAMDEWVAHHPHEQAFAQIGNGAYEPRHMEWVRFLAPSEFTRQVKRSALIVAHAGTGSFFLAAETCKPLVMLPRLAANGEHTTDHQVHTARWLCDKPGVYIAMTERELPVAIAKARVGDPVASQRTAYAPEEFLQRIRRCLVDPELPPIPGKARKGSR